jgi:hypothetical protein
MHNFASASSRNGKLNKADSKFRLRMNDGCG